MTEHHILQEIMAHIVTESKHSLYEYDGQRLVPLPVYQIGPTCVLHAISYGAQMAYRLKMFKLFRKSNLVFNVLHFLYLYEREMMVRMLYDRSRRIKGAFRVIQEFGVEVQDLGVELPGRPHLKLPHFKPFPPTMYTSAGLPIPPLKFDDICRMIQKHEVVIGSFATERIHFNKLREDEIYDFQPQPGSNFDTHCVLFVDYGYHESRPYLKFLNSQGPEFGDAGCGRVYFDRIFQTDDEFCFHTMSFHDDQASCSTSYSDVPPCGLPPATSDSAASQHLESRNVVDSDPSTNRILKMTEEDQILGVVRFVAELIWEDTEPTVSDAEINKVCDDAHRHVLAGQWLDIASLLLKSTDFFSLGVAEEGRTIPELPCFRP
jgi:hypothetical protein